MATACNSCAKTLSRISESESVMLAGKKALRLRVGPFSNRELAVKAQAQIHKELRVQGVVQSYP